MGAVQTCCLSIRPETPFYSVSLACFFSKQSLDSPENNTDRRFSSPSLHPTLLEYWVSWINVRLRICILMKLMQRLRTMGVRGAFNQANLTVHVPDQTRGELVLTCSNQF